MFDNLKQNIPIIQIIISYILYIVLLVCSSFPTAVVWIIFNIYLWLLCSITLKTYNIISFIYILCSAGIAIAISLFFIQGVEELAYPRGALMFNIEHTVKAGLLFFLCTTPLIVLALNKKNAKETTLIHKENNTKQPEKGSEWEEATKEDLQSGNYEIL